MRQKPQQIVNVQRFPILRIIWRFFTGLPLRGQPFRNNATMFYHATKGVRGHMTWWKKKSRFHRAIWRNVSFWPTLIIIAALVLYPWYTIAFLAIVTPYVAWRSWKAIRFVLFVPFNANGEIHWRWNPKIKRLFRRKYRPGLHSNVAEEFNDIPPEVE